MIRRLVSIFGIVVLGCWSVQAGAWSGVCWSAHSDYFERRSDYLGLTYSTVNVTMVSAVYFVGRPAYIAGSRLDDIAFDAVTGLGGGPSGVVVSVLYGQGMDAAMALLRSVAETPQQLATEVGGRTMEKGMAALQENNRLYRRGISGLDEADKLRFRQNQVYVDLMGPAENLYLAARDNPSTASANGGMLSALSAVEQTLRDSNVLGAVLTAVELTEILLEAGIDLEAFAPYRDYQRQVDLVREANGIIPCAEELSDAARSATEPAAAGPGIPGFPQAYIPMRMCTGGSMDSCRQYCYTSCDHDANGAINGGAGEGTCYTECNRDCDRLCLTSDALAREDAPVADAYVGGNVRLNGVLSATTPAALDDAGLVIVLPDGSSLSCMDGDIDPAYGCGDDRLRSPNGYMEELIVIRGFRLPGPHLIYLDASRSSSEVTLHVGDALVDRWSRADSFDGSRITILDFEDRTAGSGDMLLLGQIIVAEE